MHLLTQSALLRALGWSLLNSLWQMAFLWLLYAFFINVFRRASAHARHGLAVLLLGAGSLWTIITFLNAFLSADPGMAGYEFRLPLLSEGHWISTALLSARQLINEGLPWCSTLYLLALCFLFVRYGQQYLYSRRLTRTGLSKAAPELRIFTMQTGRGMGIKRNVKVWLSTLVEVPVTLGFLKPVILIPLATISQLSPQQVEALVLHELAHIRRQDYLLNLWIAVLEVFFFFNPFSRLLIRSIQKEREHRCDDLVLQFRYDPHTYVSALMALANCLQGSPRLVLAAAGSNDRLLLQRVKRILKLSNTQEPPGGRSLVFLFMTIFIAGMALSRPAVLVSRQTNDAAAVMPIPDEKPPVEPAGTESAIITFFTAQTQAKGRQAAVPVKGLSKSSCSHHIDKEGASDDTDEDMIPANASSSDEDDASMVGYVSSVSIDKRDYSITAHTVVKTVNMQAGPTPKTDLTQPVEGCTIQAPAPYVPNSSFSVQNIQDSTTLPGEQYVYLQQMATHQVELAISKMQKELQFQLRLLQQAGPSVAPELKQKRQILLEQLKLQQQYLEKQQTLQRKLERVGRKRVIVVI